MSDSVQKSREINQRLDEELTRLNQARARTVWGGVLVLVIITIYFSWINNTLQKQLDAENLSRILAMYVSETVPVYSASVQASVEKSLPHFASQAKQEVLKQMTRSRVEANEYLKSALTEVFDRVDEVLEAEIRRQGSPYRVAIALQLERLADKETALEELSGIDVVIQEAIFREIDHIIDLSLDKLQKIESQIQSAIENPDPTPREALIRTFIKYWVNFYEQNFQISGQIGWQE